MFRLLFILLTTLSITVHAQSFDDLISKGDQLYDEQEYRASAEQYEAALELQEGRVEHYYNAACSWALAGETNKAFVQLKRAAEMGWKSIDHLNRDSDLSSLHQHEQWKEIQSLVMANKAKSEEGLNIPLKEQLEYLRVKDQTLRQLHREAEEKFGNGSAEMDFFWSVVTEQDAECLAEVEAIIEEHGWVGMSEVGAQANNTLWLVIQHAELKVQEKYIPLLKASVAEGESSGRNLALLEDRIRMRKDQPQIYGSQVRLDQESNEWVVHEISEPQFVNQRRATIGLGPIEEYLNRYGIEWKVEQKER